MKPNHTTIPGLRPVHGKARALFAASTLTLLLAFPASAATIIVTNHSFEELVLLDGVAAGTAPTGWTIAPGSLNTGYWNPQNVSYANSTAGPLPSPADGSQAMYVSVADGFGYMKQTTGETITVGTTYTLTVAVGARLTGGFDADDILLRLGYGTSDYLTIIADNNFAGTGNLTAGQFTDFSVSFTAQAGQDYIEKQLAVLIGHANTGAQVGIDFDNVRLTSIPEPSAALLGGLGLLALLRRRR